MDSGGIEYQFENSGKIYLYSHSAIYNLHVSSIMNGIAKIVVKNQEKQYDSQSEKVLNNSS